MYKNSKLRRVMNTSMQPKPVFVPQKPVQDKTSDKENVEDQEIIPSSQDEHEHEDIVPSSQQDEVQEAPASQSRFLSQRHQFSRHSQEQQFRGKNYFEVCLVVGKIKITELGEFLIFITFRHPLTFVFIDNF